MAAPATTPVVAYLEQGGAFDVWECMALCERQGLDAAAAELEAFQRENEGSLARLINERFDELVVLS